MYSRLFQIDYSNKKTLLIYTSFIIFQVWFSAYSIQNIYNFVTSPIIPARYAHNDIQTFVTYYFEGKVHEKICPSIKSIDYDNRIIMYNNEPLCPREETRYAFINILLFLSTSIIVPIIVIMCFDLFVYLNTSFNDKSKDKMYGHMNFE